MATYKVIQDIEAEDKFVGPLTLRQFVFAMVGMFFGYLNFFVVTKGVPWAMIILLPPALFGFFMAIPWSKEQPTDVWVLAKIRFRMKPKVRIWNQAGIQDLVTITAPKVENKVFIKNLSQTEVKSRLKALADTIDSRGWVVKTLTPHPVYGQPASDRLVDVDALPQAVPEINVANIPDMLDDTTMDQKINEHNAKRQAELAEKLNRTRNGEPQESGQSAITITPPSEEPGRQSEEALSQQIKAKKAARDTAYKRMSSIPSQPSVPSSSATQVSDQIDIVIDDNLTEEEKALASVTQQLSPDIIALAQNNDLNVATLARQARNGKSDPNEVVVSLH